MDTLKLNYVVLVTLLVSDAQNKKNSEHSSNLKQNKNIYTFSSKKNISSAAVLTTSSKTFCIFCKSSDHGSLSCEKFSSEQKRYKLKKEGRCYECFLKPHLSNFCNAKISPCEKCGLLSHNEIFCPKEIKSKSENLENVKTAILVSSMSE